MQKILLKHNDIDFKSKEAYKTLRTNIEFSGENLKVIFLTSCAPNDGKSTVAYELAKTYAENGMKTLLIDADLRKSVMRGRVRKVMDGSVLCGLTNYLVGQVSYDEIVCESDLPDLSLIFAGPVPPNPSELLGNSKFTSMIEGLRGLYDIILIDTPPIGSVIDAAVVSKSCDGGILVIGCGSISYRFARKMKEQLERTGCKIIGCVLNKVNMNGKGYYGKYYKNYYGNYYGRYYGDNSGNDSRT